MLGTESRGQLRRHLVWAIGAVGLLTAGVAAGYLLPPSVTPSRESPVAAATARPSGGPTDVDIVESAPPSRPEAGRVWHEFALSAADARDTQEAPALAVDAHDRVCLAWASKTTADERTLFVATSDDGGETFRGPNVVRKSGIFKSSSKRANGGFERRMVPLLAAYGDTMLLAWGEAPKDGSTIRMMLAESHDGGQSFSEPRCVHRSESARPTFNALAVNRQGHIVCSWLDSRDGAQRPFASLRASSHESFSPEVEVDAGHHGGVCPCCLTSAAVADDGTAFVAYRNDKEGYRDIWLSSLPPGETRFSNAVSVTGPAWQFEGCPHDGPSLSICGGQLHVAWMDAHSGRQRAYYGRTPLSESRFKIQPLNELGPGTQGNAKLCADAAGRLHAVWEESVQDEPAPDEPEGGHSRHQHGPPTGTGRIIVHAVSPRADGRFEVVKPISPMPKRFQTRPAIACGPAGLVLVAWNELDESGKRVVVTRLNETR